MLFVELVEIAVKLERLAALTSETDRTLEEELYTVQVTEKTAVGKAIGKLIVAPVLVAVPEPH